MSKEIYRYEISEEIPFREVEESLLLAVLATESVYGRSRVRLEASFLAKAQKRSCVVDASNEIGQHIAKIFTGFLTQEFGDSAFNVSRLDKKPEPVTSGTKSDGSVSDEGDSDGR